MFFSLPKNKPQTKFLDYTIQKNTKHEQGCSRNDPLNRRTKCGPKCHQQLDTMIDDAVEAIWTTITIDRATPLQANDESS